MGLGGSGFGSSASAQNPYNERADYGISSLHRTHVFTLDYVYQLPFGKGRRFGSSMGAIGEGILGGWELTGILSARSGAPFGVGIGRDIANIGARSISQRPNVVGDPYAGAQRAPDLWITKAAFAEPSAFTFGNLGRNTLVGPGFFQMDFGGYKNFMIKEYLKLQFRAEVFNITNRANFGNPNANFDSSSFGLITGLAGAPLEAQFGLKLNF